jgi:hypothetical protein
MYKIITNIFGYKFILKIDTNLSIPMSQDNFDYQEYLAWLAEGNTPEEYIAEEV